MNIVQRITDLAAKRGISKTFLCSKMGVAKVYFNDISKTNRKIEDERLQIIADTLFTTVDYLTGKTDDDRIPSMTNLSIYETDLLETYRKLDVFGQRQLISKAYEFLEKIVKKENTPAENDESEKEIQIAVPVDNMVRNK